MLYVPSAGPGEIAPSPPVTPHNLICGTNVSMSDITGLGGNNIQIVPRINVSEYQIYKYYQNTFYLLYIYTFIYIYIKEHFVCVYKHKNTSLIKIVRYCHPSTVLSDSLTGNIIRKHSFIFLTVKMILSSIVLCCLTKYAHS